MRTLILSVLVALAVGRVARAEEGCRPPAHLNVARASLPVPPAEIAGFKQALRDFALKQDYFVQDEVVTPERLNVMLVSNASEESIVVNNLDNPNEVTAGMEQCGGSAFVPYWREFLKFLHQYNDARQNGPIRERRYSRP